MSNSSNSLEIGHKRLVRFERWQTSYGRPVQVISVFPTDGIHSPEDKLKQLVDLEYKNRKIFSEKGGQFTPPELTSQRP